MRQKVNHEDVIVRKAEPEDCFNILRLRNKKYVRAVSLNNKIIKKADHKQYYIKHIKTFFIIEYVKKMIGVLNIQADGYTSIYLDEQFQGKGIAPIALKRFYKLKAIILLDNIYSVKAFMKAGFKMKGFYFEKD